MDTQFLLKLSDRRVLEVAIAAGLLTAGVGYYTISQFSPAPTPQAKEQAKPVALQVVALGQLEPQTEVRKVSVPAALANDRVAELFVKRGDRVKAGQTIAILSSRDRLQGLLAETKLQVNLAQAELAQVRAGAKTGEINSQKAEIARIQAQSSGEERAQQATLARLEAEWLGNRNAQQAALAALEDQLAGDIQVQSATINKLTAELNNVRAELRRYQQLYSAGAISQSQYYTRRLAVDTAVQQLNEAQAGLVRTKTTGNRKISEAKANLQRTFATGSKQISEAKVVLERIRATSKQQITAAEGVLSRISEVRPVDVQTAQAKVNQTMAAAKRVEIELAQATIRAPIDGQILDIFAKPGEVVKDNGLVNLGQTDRMQVVAEVDQGDIQKVRVGQSVSITGEAFAGELRGKVRELGREVSRQNTFSNQPGENLDRRVVKVRIDLDPADSQKVAGLTNLQVQAAIQP